MHASAVCLPHPNFSPSEVITGSWCNYQQREMRKSSGSTGKAVPGWWLVVQNPPGPAESFSQLPPKTKLSIRIPLRTRRNGAHPDRRLHRSRSKSPPIRTHAQHRLICPVLFKAPWDRSGNGDFPLHNNSKDTDFKMSSIFRMALKNGVKSMW